MIWGIVYLFLAILKSMPTLKLRELTSGSCFVQQFGEISVNLQNAAYEGTYTLTKPENLPRSSRAKM